MNLVEAKRLKVGDTLFAVGHYNADGTPMRGKVTSVKTWKRNPSRVEVRYKRGLYEYGVFNENELDLITKREPARVPKNEVAMGMHVSGGR